MALLYISQNTTAKDLGTADTERNLLFCSSHYKLTQWRTSVHTAKCAVWIIVLQFVQDLAAECCTTSRSEKSTNKVVFVRKKFPEQRRLMFTSYENEETLAAAQCCLQTSSQIRKNSQHYAVRFKVEQQTQTSIRNNKKGFQWTLPLHLQPKSKTSRENENCHSFHTSQPYPFANNKVFGILAFSPSIPLIISHTSSPVSIHGAWYETAHARSTTQSMKHVCHSTPLDLPQPLTTKFSAYRSLPFHILRPASHFYDNSDKRHTWCSTGHTASTTIKPDTSVIWYL